MPKIPKDVEELQKTDFLKTNKPFRIVDDLDAARLMAPEKYYYKNRPRLVRAVTDSCKEALYDVQRLMGHLPDDKRDEIILDWSCKAIRGYSLLGIKTRKNYQLNKRAAATFDPNDFDFYSQMLVESIEGIRAMMPDQFNNLLLKQLDPFLTTLDCVSEFARANKLERKVPQFKLPPGLIQPKSGDQN